MRKFLTLLPLMAMIVLAIFKSSLGFPALDEDPMHDSTQLHSSNDKIENYDNEMSVIVKRKRSISKPNLPASPVDLLRPDTFQFYTYNQNGDVVMKQMSKKEIQSLIASSGGHLPMDIHEPQKVENIFPNDTKVSDVVQNVQNVLKGELNKPPSLMTSVPTIPGHDNSEWSNILPSILAGDTESNVTSKTDYSQDVDLPEVITQTPVTNSHPEMFSTIESEVNDVTIPMIPVPVITVEHQPSSNDDKKEASTVPIFPNSNTFTADKNESIAQWNNQTKNNFESNQMTIESESKDGVDSFTELSLTTSCSPLSSNCQYHLSGVTEKPNNVPQANNVLIEKTGNNFTNEVDLINLPIIKIPLNETNGNSEGEEPKPFTIMNSVETTTFDPQNTLKLDNEENKYNESENMEQKLNVDENKTAETLIVLNDDLKNLQAQDGNENSDSSTVTVEQSTAAEVTHETEITTLNYENLIITNETSTQNETSMIKLNSSIIEQPLIDNISDQFSSQTVLPISNQSKVPNETLNTSQIDKPVDINYDELLLIPTENTSHNPPLITTTSELLITTIIENITEINEANSSTITHTPHKTVKPINHDSLSIHIPIQMVKEKFNNSNLFNVNDENTLEEKTPVVLIDTLNTFQTSSPNTLSKPVAQISTELADSLSSMISQISHTMPSSVISTLNNEHQFNSTTDNTGIIDDINAEPMKNYETKLNESSDSENNTVNYSTTDNYTEINYDDTTIVNEFNDNHNQNIMSKEEKKEATENTSETAIVRIDIMEATSYVDKNTNVTLVKKDNVNGNNSDVDKDKINTNEEKTESPMVRIKLTDPISILHDKLESSPVQSSTQNSIEILTLPTNKNISSHNIASGLIAGFASNTNINTNEITTLKYIESDNDEIDKATEKSTVTMNITTISSITTTEIELEDNSHIPLLNTTDINEESITVSPLINTTIIDVPKCSYQNSSLSLCSTNETVEVDNIEISKIIQPLVSTTISPDSSTNSFTDDETMKQNVTAGDSITTESLEIRVDDTNDTAVPQISSENQLSDQLLIISELKNTTKILETQYTTDNPIDYSSVKPNDSSLNFEHSSEIKTQFNDSIEQTSLYSQQELPTTSSLQDIMKNSSTTPPSKIKDIKKDDSRIELLGDTKKNLTSPKPDDSIKLIEEATKLQLENSTQETKIPEKWTLIPQGIHSNSQSITQNISTPIKNPLEERIADIQKESEKAPETNALSETKGGQGLDSSIEKLDADIAYFSIICNNLAFTFWNAVNSGLSTSRSLSLSPFGMTSILAMIFLGARGPTSDRMNQVLKLDDVTSFNPHLVFQNITDSVGIAEKQGIANVAFVRELFADQSKVRKLMRFYKKQAEQFYDGVVEQINFSTISDTIRRKTNFLIRKQTGGRIRNFINTNSMPLRSPLAALSANVFQTDCSSDDATSKGRDGELYFAVSPAIRQRKLILVPATLWKTGVLAGYEPSLDATAIAIGDINNIISTIYVIPGQQGFTASDDNLDLLEQRIISGALHDGAWNKLMKVIVPRPGLELQIPKFSHKSIINATAALKTMGLEELFLKSADFKGINGVGNDFHLSDIIQMNLFSTCGDENIQNGKTKHHVETYPASPQMKSKELMDKNEAEVNDENMNNSWEFLKKNSSSLKRSNRQTNENKPRVKLDKPFLYFVRHNPTGLILFMGRFNPRLLP
ncbi:hypothetical protein PV328_011209 [Microctonus aethiopoides]|uniref:Serpin domain-containing protein n=1 Tax=Microctonus aethiopoides TaxID=144406 RepID=A0AA39C3X5_9HYME|nr:hypothetical protein PV328_011209 [Microctonus aethiopoides]